MRRAWLTRWLRVMGKGTVWLGRELALLDIDRAALARATTTTEQSGTLRVVIADDDALNVAESALGTLLPSAAQWREAARLSTSRA